MTIVDLELVQPEGISGEELSRLREIISATARTDPTPEQVTELRRFLATYPGLWKTAGDLAQLAVDAIVRNLASQPLIQESVLCGARALQAELSRPGDSALEALIARQCVVAYLHHYGLVSRFENARAKGLAEQATVHWEQRLSASQARYLHALEALARIRRLARPGMLQLNVGARQLNLAAFPTFPASEAAACPGQIPEACAD